MGHGFKAHHSFSMSKKAIVLFHELLTVHIEQLYILNMQLSHLFRSCKSLRLQEEIGKGHQDKETKVGE